MTRICKKKTEMEREEEERSVTPMGKKERRVEERTEGKNGRENWKGEKRKRKELTQSGALLIICLYGADPGLLANGRVNSAPADFTALSK